MGLESKVDGARTLRSKKGAAEGEADLLFSGRGLWAAPWNPRISSSGLKFVKDLYLTQTMLAGR